MIVRSKRWFKMSLAQADAGAEYASDRGYDDGVSRDRAGLEAANHSDFFLFLMDMSYAAKYASVPTAFRDALVASGALTGDKRPIKWIRNSNERCA